MAYTALYREWRPKTFQDVVGQEHITTTLKNQIKNNRIAHAYLFCGTRGTGKTSTAKIFSKAVNCLNLQDGEPCNECEMCRKINDGLLIDVIELDAASNNGVDKIRDIIDNVKYPPSEAKYKVYIMDEVHMLSIGAVNAFLKTLEEPPERVIFILATTDPQKLPVTILSRCQRFDFKRIKNDDVYGRLRTIVEEQGVFADDSSLNLISRMSDGAMRDALSILDQAIAMGSGKVDYEQLINMLGLVTNDNLIKLTDSIIEGNVEQSMKIIDEVILSGKDVNSFMRDMISHMRNLLMIKISNNPEEILDMSQENMDMLKEQAQKTRIEYIMRNIRILQEAEEQSKWIKQSRIYLELAALKMCKKEYDNSSEMLLVRLNKLEEMMASGKFQVIQDSNKIEGKKDNTKNIKVNKETQVAKTEKVQEEEVLNNESNLSLDIIRKNWKDILDTIKAKRQMIIYASLLTGELISFSGGTLEIKFAKDYAFNKPRLEKEENRKIIEEASCDVLKERIRLKFSVDEPEEEKIDNEEIIKQTFGEDLVEIIDE